MALSCYLFLLVTVFFRILENCIEINLICLLFKKYSYFQRYLTKIISFAENVDNKISKC